MISTRRQKIANRTSGLVDYKELETCRPYEREDH
ncbi:transposase [Wolbachia endosymbiont of Cylisticus convexus]|nr:transposase [Wolbachia endosymbiont of Cylisticus convexus]